MTARNPYAFRPHPGLRRGVSTEAPLPTRLVSNEEFVPLPQTPATVRPPDDRPKPSSCRYRDDRSALFRSGG